MSYTALQLAKITQAQLIHTRADTLQTPILHVVTDTRRITFPEDSIFIALETEHNDGHRYLQHAYEQGVRNFIIQKEPIGEFPNDVNVLQCADSLRALQRIAAKHRSELNYPILAITGSNGKTIVKEWLHQLLRERMLIARNPKSYNSQLGVPLSIWLAQPNQELGIFEAGISKPNEMQHLAEILQPNWGIFTFSGTAHNEGFPDMETKLNEKFNLFKNCERVVFCLDQNDVVKATKQLKPEQLFSWSKTNEHADVLVHYTKNQNRTTDIHFRHEEQTYSVQIPMNDDASIWNAITCFVALLAFFPALAADKSIQQKFHELSAVEMRLQIKAGIHNTILLNDSYTSDLQSLQIALESMQLQGDTRKRTVILSDMYQTGMEPNDLYARISGMIRHQHIDQFFGIGPQLMQYKSLFDTHAHFFHDTEQFLDHMRQFSFVNRLILLKGARRFAFEKIDRALEKKHHETVFEINLSAMQHNVKQFRSHIPAGTKIMAMVKAFGYGSGGHEVALALESAQVDYLAVAYSDEGVELREAGVQIPIMVMNTEYSAIDSMIQYRLEPEVYSESSLKHIAERSGGEEMSIHLEFDTGMKRLGFEEIEIPKIVALLHQNPNLRVRSVFTHLAGSEEIQHDAFTHDQFTQFERITALLEKQLGYTFIRHCLNSAGISRFAEKSMDMVRLGIGLYGVDPAKRLDLHVTGTLKTVISQIRHLQPEDSIGYGRHGKGAKKIAVTAIGYADGLNRNLSQGKGWMLVKGQKAPIIGNICMDMTMIDISEIDCEEGDDVIIFGQEPSVEQIAEWSQTIPYEVLTSVSQRVKRVFYYES